MGVFSKYHRFREAGEEANVNNVERFGNPAFPCLQQRKCFHFIIISRLRMIRENDL